MNLSWVFTVDWVVAGSVNRNIIPSLSIVQNLGYPADMLRQLKLSTLGRNLQRVENMALRTSTVLREEMWQCSKSRKTGR